MTPETPKTETPKTKEIRKIAPDIPPDLISIAMSKDDLQVFANLMSIAAKTFESLALQAAQANNEVEYSSMQSRYRLSSLFAERLVEACRMPESVSRDFH